MSVKEKAAKLAAMTAEPLAQHLQQDSDGSPLPEIADVDAAEASADDEVQAFLDRTSMQTIDGGFPLRFLKRKDGKRILQQMSTIVTYNPQGEPVLQEQVWEDIPEVTEEELEKGAN